MLDIKKSELDIRHSWSHKDWTELTERCKNNDKHHHDIRHSWSHKDWTDLTERCKNNDKHHHDNQIKASSNTKEFNSMY